MRTKSYKYHTNRKTVITTAIHFAVFIAAALLIWMMYVGGYFSAWFTSLIVALVALMIISVPRKISVDKDAVTIFCVLEIVELPIAEIVSARQIDNSECQWMIPIFGSRGFFGYYGYYLDIDTLERVHFYATEWQNLVEIVDIYDDRYYVSCRQAEDFIAQIEEYK
ncbi:MAG: PH domain-containing protein [Rikenellaceae bacterium]